MSALKRAKAGTPLKNVTKKTLIDAVGTTASLQFYPQKGISVMKNNYLIWYVMIALMLWPATLLLAEATQNTNSFEIDGEGSSINGSGQITDDGLTTAYSEQGSGQNWIHITSDPIPYMGVNCYESWCSESPDPYNNDRTEHKMLVGWNGEARYFSLAFYVPEDTNNLGNWLLFSQWWQCDSWGPPLQLSLDGDGKILLSRKYDDPPGAQVVDTIGDFNYVEKNRWYHFLFVVQFDNDDSDGLDGLVDAYLMNPATGVFERKVHETNIRLGWEYLPDGTTLAPTNNFVWKIGTYRGPTDNDTWVYYDNCRIARTWALATKSSLTGYQKCVMNLQLDESSGTTADDITTYNNNGSLINGPVWSGSGKVGNCLYFDGTNDHVRVPMDTVDFDTGNYLTVSAWFKTTYTQPSTRALVNMDGTSNFRLSIGSATQASFFVYYPDGGHDSVSFTDPNVNLFNGQWYHLVGVYNRFDPNDQKLRIYLNGTRKASSNPGYSKPLKIGSSYLYIGRYSSAYFKGYIDEVTMHNYPMTDGQVLYLNQNP